MLPLRLLLLLALPGGGLAFAPPPPLASHSAHEGAGGRAARARRSRICGLVRDEGGSTEASPDNGDGGRPPPPPSMAVGIVGAGAVAFGTAGLLSSMGHVPVIWSPSGSGAAELLASSTAASLTEGSTADTAAGPTAGGALPTARLKSTGAIDANFDVRLARSPRELSRGCDGVVLLALPVNGHKGVMEELAPEITQAVDERRREGRCREDVAMHVIISSHASLGAAYLMRLLREERRCLSGTGESGASDPEDTKVKITAWGTTAVTARKTSGTSVNVLTVRKLVDFCTVPSWPDALLEEEASGQASIFYRKQELLEDGRGLCTALFGPRFYRRRGGLLAVSLSNLNPQNHLGIVLGNMSRMEAGESWYQGKNVTPNVGRLMEALDRERLAIAEALEIEVRTIREHFSWSFHVPMEVPACDRGEDGGNGGNGNLGSDDTAKRKTRPLTVSEMNQRMHLAGNDVLGPSSPDSRYVVEDVPYGLVLTTLLGRLVGRRATLHEAGIGILSAMYGRDFVRENELLRGLGLLGGDPGEEGDGGIPHLDRWREMASSGYFRDS